MSVDSPANEESVELERRVEALATELVGLINSGRSADREGLKDIALSIVRDEVQGREGEAPRQGRAGSPSGPFSAIGMAMPLGLAGAIMIFLFPPVGLALFAVAGLLAAFGLAAAMFSRR